MRVEYDAQSLTLLLVVGGDNYICKNITYGEAISLFSFLLSPVEKEDAPMLSAMCVGTYILRLRYYTVLCTTVKRMMITIADASLEGPCATDTYLSTDDLIQYCFTERHNARVKNEWALPGGTFSKPTFPIVDMGWILCGQDTWCFIKRLKQYEYLVHTEYMHQACDIFVNGITGSYMWYESNRPEVHKITTPNPSSRYHEETINGLGFFQSNGVEAACFVNAAGMVCHLRVMQDVVQMEVAYPFCRIVTEGPDSHSVWDDSYKPLCRTISVCLAMMLCIYLNKNMCQSAPMNALINSKPMMED